MFSVLQTFLHGLGLFWKQLNKFLGGNSVKQFISTKVKFQLVLKLRQNGVRRVSEVKFVRLVKLLIELKGELWEKNKKNHRTKKWHPLLLIFYAKKTHQTLKLSSCIYFLLSQVNRITSYYFLGDSRKNPWRIYTVLADEASWSYNVNIEILVSGNINPLFFKCILIGRQSIPLCYCLWPMLSLLRWATVMQFRWLYKLLSPCKSYLPELRAPSALTLFQCQV